MRLCTLAIALCLCTPAWAEEAPTHRADLIAWSSDGATALVKEVITQPDGSGERAVRLISQRVNKRYVFSQVADSSAAVAQKVSERSCIQRLKSLDTRLKKLGFTGLSLDMQCTNRAELIKVGGAVKAQSADTWFSGEGLTLVRGALEMSVEDNILIITSNNAPVSTWDNTPQPLQMKAAMASSGRLMLVFYGWGSGNWRIVKALGSKSGDPKDFRNVRI